MAALRHWNIFPERMPGDSGPEADIVRTKSAWYFGCLAFELFDALGDLLFDFIIGRRRPGPHLFSIDE